MYKAEEMKPVFDYWTVSVQRESLLDIEIAHENARKASRKLYPALQAGGVLERTPRDAPSRTGEALAVTLLVAFCKGDQLFQLPHSRNPSVLAHGDS